jgi:hypothetical protein
VHVLVHHIGGGREGGGGEGEGGGGEGGGGGDLQTSLYAIYASIHPE